LAKDPAKMTPKELKAAVQAETDERTTPQIYFMTARAYHVSARSLMKNRIPKLSHRDQPIRALFHHAAELYLKALLLHSGMTPAQLRGRRGHDYEQLVDEALKRGLVLAPAFVATLKSLQQLGAFSMARYPFVGTVWEVGLQSLSGLCNALAPSIGPRVLGGIPPARADIIEPI
jgi:hypothetical protein